MAIRRQEEGEMKEEGGMRRGVRRKRERREKGRIEKREREDGSREGGLRGRGAVSFPSNVLIEIRTHNSVFRIMAFRIVYSEHVRESLLYSEIVSVTNNYVVTSKYFK